MGTKTLNDARLANIEQGERAVPGKCLNGLQKPFADSLRLIVKVQREE